MTQPARSAGRLAVGVVVNVKDDPSQSGRVRVRWISGSADQSSIADEDLPWTPTMSPSTDPALAGTGGPHLGLRVGSTVLGMPLDDDGQTYMVVGSTVKGGPGRHDVDAQYSSDLPAPAKVETNGGESQPKYGDKNGIVTEGSILAYAENEAGGRAAKFSTLGDSIGALDEEII